MKYLLIGFSFLFLLACGSDESDSVVDAGVNEEEEIVSEVVDKEVCEDFMFSLSDTLMAKIVFPSVLYAGTYSDGNKTVEASVVGKIYRDYSESLFAYNSTNNSYKIGVMIKNNYSDPSYSLVFTFGDAHFDLWGQEMFRSGPINGATGASSRGKTITFSELSYQNVLVTDSNMTISISNSEINLDKMEGSYGTTNWIEVSKHQTLWTGYTCPEIVRIEEGDLFIELKKM